MPDLAAKLHEMRLGCRRDFRGDCDCGGPQWHTETAQALAPEIENAALRRAIDAVYVLSGGGYEWMRFSEVSQTIIGEMRIIDAASSPR